MGILVGVLLLGACGDSPTAPALADVSLGRIIFVTSENLDPAVVNYYLALLPGIPSSHARRRLVMLACNDASNVPLSAKILRRPRLLSRIRDEILDLATAHMVCFNSTELERSLAVQLGIPLHSVDPALNDLGTKSGCREVFGSSGMARVTRYPP